MTAAGPPSGPSRYLTFRAAGERFGIPVERVRGAHRPKRIAPLPGAPPAYAGVVLIKGEALGVIDARRALVPGGAEGPVPASVAIRPVLLLFSGDSRALLVDRVDEIEEVSGAGVTVPAGLGRHVVGIVERDGRRLSLVDLDGLLGGGCS